MIVYRVSFHDPSEGTMLSWYSTKRQAEAALRKLQFESPNEPQGVETVDAIDIPTTRKGLIAWLNRNFNTDNG